MGFSGVGVWQLLILLVIVGLVFGTKKLRNAGSDLGHAMKSFRSAVKEGDEIKRSIQDPASLDREGGAHAGADQAREGKRG